MRGAGGRRLALVLAALWIGGVPRLAWADAEPAVGFVYGSLAAPVHVSLLLNKPGFTEGEWETRREVGQRTGTLGLDGATLGAGVGYDGWNVQIELRNAVDLQSGTLSVGKRFNLQSSDFEGWVRFAAGPGIFIDFDSLTLEEDVSGGLESIVEVGADWFVWKETLALGVKAVSVPSYAWPLRFSLVFDLSVGVRLVI